MVAQKLSSTMLAINVCQQTALVFSSNRTVWALKLGLLPTFKLEMSCQISLAHVHLSALGASKYISSLCYRMSTISLLQSMFISIHNMNFTLQLNARTCVADVSKHLLKYNRHSASVLRIVMTFWTE